MKQQNFTLEKQSFLQVISILFPKMILIFFCGFLFLLVPFIGIFITLGLWLALILIIPASNKAEKAKGLCPYCNSHVEKLILSGYNENINLGFDCTICKKRIIIKNNSFNSIE